MDHDRTIRVPVYLQEHYSQVSKFSRIYKSRHGSDPSDQEVFEFLKGKQGDREKGPKLTLEKVQFLRELSTIDQLLSLDQPIDDENSTFHDTCADTNVTSPDDSVEHLEARERLEEALTCLSARQERVLRGRVGLYDGQYGVDETLKELGEELGVTKERIRQIQVKAVKKLRKKYGDELRPLL